MGIPKYLEGKIKSIIKCCTEAIQAAITPNSPTFLISRPNQEPFVLDGPNNDQAVVGMADYSELGVEILTGRQYVGNDVYEQRFEVPLTTTAGNATLANTLVDRLFEVDIVFFEDITGDKYWLNGTLNTVCDATLVVRSNGDLEVTWTTAHTADALFVYVRYTKI
jgi:hypothetical protein